MAQKFPGLPPAMQCSPPPWPHHCPAPPHFALVCLLQPLAQPDEAALLQRGQVPQVPLDVVGVQLVCKSQGVCSSEPRTAHCGPSCPEQAPPYTALTSPTRTAGWGVRGWESHFWHCPSILFLKSPEWQSGTLAWSHWPTGLKATTMVPKVP